jgi:drug/metabolite transporter (DMT)-like permease
MTAAPWLWIVFTLIAAGAQTVRNATQRHLIGTLGAAGATHVRFLFGLPFALLFLVGVLAVSGAGLPMPSREFWPWVLMGALSQIAATALMLAAMNVRSFVVAYAYIKTEPVLVALFGLVLLGDALSAPVAAAIMVATAGVVLISMKPGKAAWDGRAALLGLISAAMFGLSAVGYRAAILSLGLENYVLAATFTVTIGLGAQTALLSLWLAARRPGTMRAILAQWRPSMLAGFLGALASQFWFLGFALTSAANVRTLGLVEVLFAQGISHFAFRQRTTWREAGGIALIVAGVGLLVAVH